MTETLKPCPFCGGSGDIRRSIDVDDFGTFYSVKCNNCGAQAKEHFAAETCPEFFAGVRESWNTRADTQS